MRWMTQSPWTGVVSLTAGVVWRVGAGRLVLAGATGGQKRNQDKTCLESGVVRGETSNAKVSEKSEHKSMSLWEQDMKMGWNYSGLYIALSIS